MAARLKVLIAALLFSTGGAAIKAVTLSSWQIAALRSIVAAITILVLLPAARRVWNRQIVGVGFAYAGALVFYALANKLTTAANTIFLQSTAPLYIVVLAPYLLKERLRRRDLIFMAAMLCGLAVFFVGSSPASTTAPHPLPGNLLGLAAGVSWALAVVGLRWMSRGGSVVSGTAAAAVVAGNFIAVLVCLPKALPIEAIAPGDGLIVLYLGVVQVGIAYVFLTSGLRQVPAFEASLLLLLEPVLNPLWAWWLHGERPGGWALVGGSILLLATAVKTLTDLSHRRSSPRASP